MFCNLYLLLQAQRNILDTELDLYAKENTGVDTSDLRKRVYDLKQRVSLQYIIVSKTEPHLQHFMMQIIIYIVYFSKYIAYDLRISSLFTDNVIFIYNIFAMLLLIMYTFSDVCTFPLLTILI